MSTIETELLGFEIAFSLPDWFPPESENYTNVIYYGKGHAWAGSVDRVEDMNHALDALHELPNIHETAVMQVCGNWVTFKLEDIDPSLIQEKTEECRQLLNDFIKQWVKPIIEHEYLIQQKDGGGVFEVLDLSSSTPGEVVWSDPSYEACQEWFDQPVSNVRNSDQEAL